MSQTLFEKLQLADEKNLLIQGLPSSIEKQFNKLSFAKNMTPLLKSRKIDFALVFAVSENQLNGILTDVMPSLKEGFPVAVVEAMKAGLVPLVTNWDGATEELIVDGETGFYVEPGNANGYADKIALLNSGRDALNKIAASGRKRANELFDPLVNTKAIEEIIYKASKNNLKNKKADKVYGSRLDQEWIFNTITHSIRKLIKN